jgi:hypothetical protein
MPGGDRLARYQAMLVRTLIRSPLATRSSFSRSKTSRTSSASTDDEAIRKQLKDGDIAYTPLPVNAVFYLVSITLYDDFQGMAKLNLNGLPYIYDDISFPQPETHPKFPLPKIPTVSKYPYLRISGIDRSSIAGSFIISAWAKEPGKSEEILVGYEPVFSRWNISGCANCNSHLEVTAYIPLDGFSQKIIDKARFESRLGTSESRGGSEIKGDEHMTTLQ